MGRAPVSPHNSSNNNHQSWSQNESKLKSPSDADQETSCVWSSAQAALQSQQRSLTRNTNAWTQLQRFRFHWPGMRPDRVALLCICWLAVLKPPQMFLMSSHVKNRCCNSNVNYLNPGARHLLQPHDLQKEVGSDPIVGFKDPTFRNKG